MSKLPTAPIARATTALASALAAKPSRDKEMKGPVQHYYGRNIRLAAAAAKMVADLKTLSERESETGKFKGTVGATLAKAIVAHDNLNSMLGQWTALHDAGWVPAKVSRGPVAGSVLALKDFAVERFTKHGAYTKTDVEKLKVVSVHGNQVKVATLKGENLGVINVGWLVRQA